MSVTFTNWRQAILTPPVLNPRKNVFPCSHFVIRFAARTKCRAHRLLALTSENSAHQSSVVCKDDVAEWLRRGTANPLGSARVSSNLIVIELSFFVLTRRPPTAPRCAFLVQVMSRGELCVSYLWVRGRCVLLSRRTFYLIKFSKMSKIDRWIRNV